MTKNENLHAILVARLPEDLMEKLKRIALQKGIETSTLARMWIKEKLRAAR